MWFSQFIRIIQGSLILNLLAILALFVWDWLLPTKSKQINHIKMGRIKDLKQFLVTCKQMIKENSFDSILFIVDTIPNAAGFSIRKEKVYPYFWIVHISLLFYVYLIGNLVYQIWYAEGAGDFIKSYVNISLLALIANNSYWFLTKRPQIKSIIRKAKMSDDLIGRTPQLQTRHLKLLKTIKYTLLGFYGWNYLNASVLYIRHRCKLTTEFAAIPCVGIEPLTTSPNKEFCITLLIIQELTVMIVVLNYQCLLVFLIGHTALSYHLLAEELISYSSEDVESIDDKLPTIIQRHRLILDIIDHLNSLYSIPMGINFASNAVCIAFFFYLPLSEWFRFIPIMTYCFLVFFLYCFLGQTIINGAEEFERAVYGCGWEKFGVRERKMICLMLALAQKDVQIFAADIVPVNIYTFATTLQAMFKFVTVVKF